MVQTPGFRGRRSYESRPVVGWSIIAFLGLVIFAAPAFAQESNATDRSSWVFSFLSGLGAREIDGEGHAARLVGLSVLHVYSDRIELGAETFILLPDERLSGPKPIHLSDENLRGSEETLVNDTDFLALFRMKVWLADWKLRPYVGVGGGIHFKKRTRIITRAIRERPDGTPRLTTRDLSESETFLASMFAAGLALPVADRWSLRSEARLPAFPAGSTHTFGFVVAVSYIHK